MVIVRTLSLKRKRHLILKLFAYLVTNLDVITAMMLLLLEM